MVITLNRPAPRRLYVVEGRAYLLRDVREDEKFLRCEYATMTHGGEIVWTPCQEGAAFDEIAPLSTIRLDT